MIKRILIYLIILHNQPISLYYDHKSISILFSDRMSHKIHHLTRRFPNQSFKCLYESIIDFSLSSVYMSILKSFYFDKVLRDL